jgi:Ca2+-transporting ATPase
MDKEKEKNLSYGLNDQQVEQSRREHGENLLTPPKRTSLLRLYLEKYKEHNHDTN